ncbi:NUDIX hydrolase [Peribacillus sp. NPDC097295]|uniref:NUDIX hydrolase n=1 Tax=Peribacillus sp. NPDC097295 TaxID=3364402 RepID=UPI0038292C81
MKIPYTICFITRVRSARTEILMLHRKNDPNRNKWNGVGGKIEEGETIDGSMAREIIEETGLNVKDMSFRGIVTWNETGGMYVYRAEDTGGELIACDEGELAWKPYEWVMETDEAVSNIKHYLNEVLFEDSFYEFALTYENERLLSVEKKHLTDKSTLLHTN